MASDEPEGPPPLDAARASRAVRRCLALLEPGERARWAILVPLALLAAGLEAAGAALIFTLIRFISAPDEVEGAEWLAQAREMFGLDAEARFLVVFSLAVAGFYVVKNGVLIFNTYYTSRCAGLSVDSLSKRLLRGYLWAPYRDHLGRNSSELVRNTSNTVVAAYRSMLMSLVHAVSESMLLLALLAVLVVASPGITLVAVGGVSGVVLLFLRFTQTWMVRWGYETHQIHGRILGQLTQSLAGVKEVKVLGREQHFLDGFVRLRTRLSRLGWRQTTVDNVPRLVMETFFVLAVVVVILVFEQRGAVANVVPVLGLFAYTGFRMLPALHRITSYVNVIRYGSAAIDEIWEDANRYGAREDRPPPPPAERMPLEGRIEVRDVSFTYTDARGPALSQVSLTIGKGESIGIVGSTGAGKTTFVDLLLGLLEPSAGEILVDGRDIRSDLRGWRANIGYVPQSIYLIDDTLRRNVALGFADDAIDDARVAEATRVAALDGLLGRLPDGVETIVGERGVRLSGGERQRVAIARALYHRPEILLFDEATSALDNQTEREITEAIEGFRGAKTVLVVAHRLSTVRRCDRIVVLEDGRIRAEGTYDHLVANDARFRALAEAGQNGPVEIGTN